MSMPMPGAQSKRPQVPENLRPLSEWSLGDSNGYAAFDGSGDM